MGDRLLGDDRRVCVIGDATRIGRSAWRARDLILVMRGCDGVEASKFRIGKFSGRQGAGAWASWQDRDCLTPSSTHQNSTMASWTQRQHSEEEIGTLWLQLPDVPQLYITTSQLLFIHVSVNILRVSPLVVALCLPALSELLHLPPQSGQSARLRNWKFMGQQTSSLHARQSFFS
jgi:hypothetical protein